MMAPAPSPVRVFAGAAFGAKLVSPNQDVVLTRGDGYFTFGAALGAAAHYHPPFLSVVMVNRSHSMGTTTLARDDPGGVAASTRNFNGGTFDPPADFAKLAAAANAHGETVREPERSARHWCGR